MKILKVKLPDEQHGRLAGASRKSGKAMVTIIADGIDGELGRLADELNGGKPWRRAKSRVGRRPVPPCAACGAALVGSAEFCPYCGKAVG